MVPLIKGELRLRGRYRASVALNLDEPIAVVSDLHLEGNRRDLTCIGKALSALGVLTLIFNGDLFDRMAKLRTVTMSMLRYSMVRLGLTTDTLTTAIYVVSSGNHDPHVAEPKEFIVGKVKLFVVPEVLLFSSGGRWFAVTHGDLFIRDGVLAALVELTMGRGFVERLARSLMGLSDDVVTVLGHTHVPVSEGDVFNTGSWISRLMAWPSDTVLLIIRGRARLLRLPC